MWCVLSHILCWVCTCKRVVDVTKSTNVQTHSLRWSVYRFVIVCSLLLCFFYFITSLELKRKSLIITNICVLYREFHNVLRDYKHLQQENQRTYLNGIFHSHRKTEIVDVRVATSWISYRCVPCQPRCTHRTSLAVKKNYFSFPVAVKNSIKVGPLVFLL
jgi:hypothetical protein